MQAGRPLEVRAARPNTAKWEMRRKNRRNKNLCLNWQLSSATAANVRIDAFCLKVRL
jgi:hypothetical protein